MPVNVTQWIQLGILWVSAASFALAFVMGWRFMRRHATVQASGIEAMEPASRLGPAARLNFGVGMGLALLLIAWRVLAEEKSAQANAGVPLANYFDSFLLLGIALAGLGIYFRLTRHLSSLAFFLLPMIALVFAFGGVLSLIYQQAFDYSSAVNVVHVISIMIGSAGFAASCAGGAVYLLADRQLRQRGPAAERRWIRFPALASIEKFNQHAVLIGFPLLTLAMITGAFMQRTHADFSVENWWASPKIILAIAAWLVYAGLLYIRLAPSFRGRRAAWLSIIGFVLLLGVFLAVKWTGKA